MSNYEIVLFALVDFARRYSCKRDIQFVSIYRVKYLLQQVTISFLAIFVTSILFSGLVIKGDFVQLLYAAILLVLGFLLVRPILNLIALPITLLTLGLFSIVTTIAVVFLVTLIDKNFIIKPFLFPGFTLLFIQIPKYYLNIFLSYIVISVTIQLIHKMLVFLLDL